MRNSSLSSTLDLVQLLPCFFFSRVDTTVIPKILTCTCPVLSGKPQPLKGGSPNPFNYQPDSTPRISFWYLKINTLQNGDFCLPHVYCLFLKNITRPSSESLTFQLSQTCINCSLCHTSLSTSQSLTHLASVFAQSFILLEHSFVHLNILC